MRRPRAERAFHALLRLLPSDFRRRHGAAMAATFRERLDRTPSGRRRVALLASEGVDVAATALRLRLAGAGTWIDDVRHALRSLRRNPAHTVFAGATLALGIGATTAIFSALDSVLLRPLDYPDADRVVTAWRSQREGSFIVTPSAEQARALEALDGVFEAVEPSSTATRTLSGRGDPALVEVVEVRAGFFRFAGVAPVRGRLFTEDERMRGEAVALVSEAVWSSRFGRDPAVLGSVVRVDGRDRTVVGVVPTRAVPPGPFLDAADVWLPLRDDPDARGLSVVARLRPGVTVEQAVERANAGAAADERWRITLRTARDMVHQGLRDTLVAVSVAVGFLLLIACVNVSNLLLARAEARLHESAVRSAIGAGRARLVRQHLMESVLLSLGAGVGGLAVALGFLDLASALRPDELKALDRASLDGGVLLFAVAVSTGTGLAFGLLPALRGTAPAARVALRSGRGGEARSRRLASTLVAAEVALSFLLLTGTGLVLRTVADLQSTDVGFDADRLLAVEVQLPEWRHPEPAGRAALMERLRERAAELPSVEAATVALNVPPRTGIWFGVPEAEGGPAPAPDAETRIFFMNAVRPGYFGAVGLPLRAGRDFTPAEAADSVAGVMILSEAGARELFPQGDAVGGRLRIDQGKWYTVVGVAGEVKAGGLNAGSLYPQVYFPSGGVEPATTLILRAEGDPAALADAARALVREADPALPPPEISSVASRYAGTIARERFTLTLLAVFAATALVLAAVGLYGVIAQIVGRRTREIGIRMSLGAERRGVFRMVLRQGLATTAVGVAVGAALAAAGARLLSAGLFGVEPADPLVWGVAAIVLVSVALSATWMPARRAARVDPVRAMRAE